MVLEIKPYFNMHLDLQQDFMESHSYEIPDVKKKHLTKWLQQNLQTLSLGF